jgi:hypothetical protein
MSDISQLTENLINDYKAWQDSLNTAEGVSLIHADEVASRLAFFYEKIKSIVDWHEEHLIRKVAIERDLKRRLVFQKESKDLAESLILELIRGGYFDNNKIEESKIADTQRALDRYIYILNNAPDNEEKKELSRWLLKVAACEIEEILDPPLKQQALISYMFQSMVNKIELTPEAAAYYKLTETEKNIQIYIATQKALFKFDQPLISYNLIKTQYQNWDNLDRIQLENIAKNIYLIWENINNQLNHPVAKKFYAICEKYDAPYLILGDVISREPQKAEEFLKNPENLENSLGAAYDKREKIIKERVKRAAIYATLSIFISKVLLVIALEIPFDKYIAGKFSYFSLAINILIPPLLMLLLVASIKAPGKDNRQQVIIEGIKIAYRREKEDHYQIKAAKKRSVLTNFIIYLVYILTFFLTFGLIIDVLKKLHFSVFSQIVFIFFICLISFAGVKIRDRAKELEIIEKKENFLNFLIDLISLPVIKIGHWLAEQLSRYNAIIIFLNVLIDTPFQVFLEFFEKWRAFLKEKKAENI